MVTEYGMSTTLGAVKLAQASGEVFLGRDMGHQRDYSDSVAQLVDTQVRELIDQAHTEAWKVLNPEPCHFGSTGQRATGERNTGSPPAGRDF